MILLLSFKAFTVHQILHLGLQHAFVTRYFSARSFRMGLFFGKERKKIKSEKTRFVCLFGICASRHESGFCLCLSLEAKRDGLGLTAADGLDWT